MRSCQDPTLRSKYAVEDLHPKVREHFRALEITLRDRYAAGLIKTEFRPFEGFRSLERQTYLFNEARTTKAKAWQSAHNYGLAVDFVAWIDGKWSWDEAADWAGLARAANDLGLMVPIKWDRPHVEHPIWTAVKNSLV